MSGERTLAFVSPVNRFEWERLLRDADLPALTKGVCLLVATYMNADGTSARPAVWRPPSEEPRKDVRPPKTLCEQLGLQRSTVQAHLKAATAAGWFVSVDRPGRPTERIAAVPLAHLSAGTDTYLSAGTDTYLSAGTDMSAQPDTTCPPSRTHLSAQPDTTRPVPDQDQTSQGARDEEDPVLHDDEATRDADALSPYGRSDWQTSWCAEAIGKATSTNLCTAAEAPRLMQALADDPSTTSPRRLTSKQGVAHARRLLKAPDVNSSRKTASSCPDWCGLPACRSSTRRIEDPDTGADCGPCPRCHPSTVRSAA